MWVLARMRGGRRDDGDNKEEDGGDLVMIIGRDPESLIGSVKVDSFERMMGE